MYYDKEWGNLTSEEKQEIKKANGGAGTGVKQKWLEAKNAAQSHQSQSGQRETRIDKPEADGTGGLYTDKKWSKLTDKEKEEIKVIHAQGPDGPFKGAKDSWQHQRAKSMGFESEQDKKDTWEAMRAEADNSSGETTTQSTEVNNSSAADTTASVENNTTEETTGSMTAHTYTKDGKIEAPDWYKNADGSTPGTMQKGLTKEKWEAQNAPIKQKQDKLDAKMQAKEKAQAHLQSGGSRDAEFDKILADGGINNKQYQEMVNTEKKAAYDTAEKERKNTALQYGNFIKDLISNRGDATLERAVDQSAHYQHLMDTTGSYGVSGDKLNAVKKLMGTGQKFDNLDIKREMSNPTNNPDGLYKEYGGRDNYFEYHSVGSGNWRSNIPQDQLGTMKEADDKQRGYWEAENSFYNNPAFLAKYGGFDFFNKSKNRTLENSERMTSEFDKRAERMEDNPYGHVYGY